MTRLDKLGRPINPKSLANLKKAKSWKPGESGNPSGKSRSHYDLVKKAKAAGPAAFKTILEVMENPKAPVSLRVKCAIEVLDRGYGRPLNPQHVRVDGEIDHKSEHLEALRMVNAEFATKQRNGTRVIDGNTEPQDTYAIPSDGSEDECADS
jgi:hypothetical protein